MSSRRPPKPAAASSAGKVRAGRTGAEPGPRAGVVREQPDGDAIVVRGARHHNLKGIDVSVPRNRLTVVCGVSGSGKSSLAFDTLFAEGQRRYIESLSSYARQFLGQIDKPDVDAIEGLSPAVAIDQKSTSHNPRSTVGTVTELWDHLRLLYARIGTPHCVHCDLELASTTPGRLADRVEAQHAGRTVTVLAPLVRDRKGSHEQLYQEKLAAGYTRARTDGTIHRLEDAPKLEKAQRHRIELVVDRVTLDGSRRRRLVDAVETAFKEADGQLVLLVDGDEERHSLKLSCPRCGTSREELEPRTFSFNSPYGACSHCDGLGSDLEVDATIVVPDQSLTLAGGAIEPWEGRDSSVRAHFQRMLTAVVRRHGGTMTTPWRKLPARTRRAILDGDTTLTVKTVWETRWETREYETLYEGVRPWIRRRFENTASDSERERWGRYLRPQPCRACHGTRLRPEALAVRVAGFDIAATAAMPVTQLRGHMGSVRLDAQRALIAERLLREINARLAFLDEVGLGYLSLDRGAATLSGGEAQRIRLATQIGSGLTGVLYVLDEPSIGLHPRDNQKLIATLQRLRDLGNTVLVVEHDEETIAAADWAVEIGPQAGERGGELTFQGPAALLAASDTVTGAYLSGRAALATPRTRRSGNGHSLEVRGIEEHNCRDLDVRVPLGRLVCVTGVSGSGKSTVVSDVIAAALARALNGANGPVGRHRRISGLEHLDKLVVVDQSPIGRTPRSNPVTYTGVFDEIRSLFAQTLDARTRGYQPGRFSFNVRGGRCEPCQGEGTVRIEMNFLPDVYVPCEHCDGRRYNADTLEVRYKDRSVADVLAMTVDDACGFFANVPSVSRKLGTLKEVGLGYIRLGQPATTLSGGEAQRVKLASELQKRSTGRTMYVLDEPTTGLHFDDVAKLVAVLGRLAEGGNTVLVIEHNLDVIRSADHVIDLGPEGGPGGGQIVGEGTPEQVAELPTATGRALRAALVTARRRERGGHAAT